MAWGKKRSINRQCERKRERERKGDDGVVGLNRLSSEKYDGGRVD